MADAGDWRLLVEDEEIPLPRALDDWDYQMDLVLRRTVQVDPQRARTESGLPPDAVLALSVVWTATGSNLRAPADHIRLEGPDARVCELNARLRGVDLGGSLVVDTALVLAEGTTKGKAAAPRRAGSVLWSDRHSVRLQGDAPQFPMAVIDFANTSFPDGAAWHLQIGNDLLGATMGSLLLLVNETNAATAAAFRNAGKPRPMDRAVLSTVYADVARIMLEHALRHPDFVDGAEFPDETLGSTLMGLFDRLFPASSIQAQRLNFESSASHFASDLQAAVKIFQDI
ncbi:hypothetical protein [Streptomyces sp. NPDC093589]|uniref:hypothetical protein n=1 Tax=Streptomyces sp. NPDC093589 TaxID=3366043 RepID=UPI003823DEBE